MTKVLFVSNGHGEASVAERIASDVRAIVPEVQLDHLALVGDGGSEFMRDVGPRRRMPSGGLVAMGNVTNIARDLGAGLVALTLSQYRFLRRARGTYATAVAVGDAYGLLMTLAAGAPTIFVGTAKSVAVAPYGPWEERILRRAAAIFVRDRPTADRLARHGLRVEPAANVIVDLFAVPDDARAQETVAGFEPAIALLPGSRENAYEQARFLLAVVRALRARRPRLGAVLSIARWLDPQRLRGDAVDDGWSCRSAEGASSFALELEGQEVVRVWRGALGPMLSRVCLVLGQAGTANEAAAAAGVPVVAFERTGDRDMQWYRRRQQGLLGDALAIVPERLDEAVRAVDALLADEPARSRMSAVGKARMGPAGGASKIAREIARQVNAALGEARG